ncbi:hypothetical protein ACFLYY_00285 [Patescibacteria group bacterium]
MDKFLEKIRKLPFNQRKIILWSTITIIALFLLFFFVKNIEKSLKEFRTEDLKKELGIPELQKELNNLPKFEIPKNEISTSSEIQENLEEI